MTESIDFAASTRRVAVRALVTIMGAAAIAWVLFIAGQYAELVRSANSEYRYDEPEQVTFTQFFTVAAIAALGLGALLAKRRLAVVRAESAPRSRLVEPVSQLASIVLILASVLAAIAVFATFMTGFFSYASEPAPLARIVNLYLPIVLYTALVVTLILAGFVFAPAVARIEAAHIAQAPIAQAPVEQAAVEQTPPADVAIDAAADAAPNRQRTVALAYATPIIAAAIALLLGLIVYDVTRTALQVWIWVVIFAIVGAGVLAGAVLAARSSVTGAHDAPVVGGAKALGFVLSIVFTAVVVSMSLGYGSSAVQQLNVWPGLSLSAYGTNESYEGKQVTVEDPSLSLWGSDMKRGSEVVVMLEPGGEQLVASKVGGDRWVGEEIDWPEDLPAGDHELVVTAVTNGGATIELILGFTTDEAGASSVRFPAGSSADYTVEQGQLQPISAGWLFGDLLPAAVLLALGLALVSATVIVRNRDLGYAD